MTITDGVNRAHENAKAKGTKDRRNWQVILLPLVGKGRIFPSAIALAEHFGIHQQTVYVGINRGSLINAGGNKCFVDYALEEKPKA